MPTQAASRSSLTPEGWQIIPSGLAKECDLSVSKAHLSQPAQQKGFQRTRNFWRPAIPCNLVEKTVRIPPPQIGKRYTAIYDFAERQAEPP
jgi:hypothetical protein